MTVTTEAAERLMKRCQIGVRYSQKNWEEAHDIMAACYGTIGALVQERDRMKGEAEVARALIDDLHFHDTRHEGITRLSRRLPILALARAVGHRDLRMLQIYYNESGEDLAKMLD